MYQKSIFNRQENLKKTKFTLNVQSCFKIFLILNCSMTVGIYFATTTGKTEDIAERLHGLLDSAEAPKDISDVDDLSELTGHDGVICGIPTWNTGADSERSGTAWDSILEDIGALDLNGKKVAIFGLGDSSTYTETIAMQWKNFIGTSSKQVLQWLVTRLKVITPLTSQKVLLEKNSADYLLTKTVSQT